MKTTSTTSLPNMPEIGRRESHYAQLARRAKECNDPHARAGAKVGQYLTLASDPRLSWEEKLEYFQHCLRRHCVPPEWPDDETWMFYQGLANLVRQHAGKAALGLAHAGDDQLAARLAMGQPRDEVEDASDRFFARLIPDGKRPDWFNEAEYDLLALIRNKWI
ncbi:MAG: hypothetical protein WBD40_15245 [Tepidisphaeraceae bacterium]